MTLILKITNFDKKGNIQSTYIEYQDVAWKFYRHVNLYRDDDNYILKFNETTVLVYRRDNELLWVKIQLLNLGEYED